MAQLSPPEYAFVASDAAWQRARGAVAALTALGYDARLYPPGAPEPQRAKAVVYCDAAPEVARFVYDVLAPGRLEPAGAAYAVTCADLELAQETAPRLGRAVEVVPDPVLGERRAPRAARAKTRSRPLEWLARRAGLATDAWRLRLAWIGSETGVETIVGAYPMLAALGRELPLDLACVAAPAALERLRSRLPEKAPEGVRIAFEEASAEALSRALDACDFALVPGDPRLRRMAVHAGRIPVAADNPCEAIRRALAHPREALENLQRAQSELDETHAPALVARAWARILMKGRR